MPPFRQARLDSAATWLASVWHAISPFFSNVLIISKVPAHWVYLNNAFTEIVHDGFVTISSADTAEKLGPDPSSKTISIVFDRSFFSPLVDHDEVHDVLGLLDQNIVLEKLC